MNRSHGDGIASPERISHGAKPGKVSTGGASKASRSSLSILVIDDDPAFCKLTARCVDDFAQVSFRFGVPEYGILDLDGFDVVLLDYKLPVRDGIEILEEIRGISRSIPVLFLTAYGDPDLAQRALEIGATAFLPKPIEIRRLRQAIEDACDRPKRRYSGKNFGSHMDRSLSDFPESFQEFTAVSGLDEQIDGKVVRFGYRSVFVLLPQGCGLSRGDELKRVEFRFGEQTLKCGRGLIRGVSRSSSEDSEVEIMLFGSWEVNLEEVKETAASRGGRQSRGISYSSLLEDWSELSPEFRLAVNDLAESLDALEAACAKTFPDVQRASIEKFSVESELASEVARQYGEVFWKAIVRFEAAASRIEKSGSSGKAKRYARRVLFPYILASPFLARIVERPIGVPGDFGMLGQILGNPLDGYEPYGRILNSWILSCGAASAYRHRVELLHREIVGTVERVNGNESRPAKILSMASGVAYELQRFLGDASKRHHADFTLVDFSEVTLKEAERQISLFGDIPKNISLNLHRSSVIDLANQARGLEIGGGSEGFRPGSDYDLVYCAGLFDYLSDRLIVRVTQYLFSLLGRNGELVVSNFTTRNPLRAWMTYVVDWELVYRSVEQFEDLMRQAMGDDVELQRETDADGVEVYILLRK